MFSNFTKSSVSFVGCFSRLPGCMFCLLNFFEDVRPCFVGNADIYESRLNFFISLFLLVSLPFWFVTSFTNYDVLGGFSFTLSFSGKKEKQRKEERERKGKC